MLSQLSDQPFGMPLSLPHYPKSLICVVRSRQVCRYWVAEALLILSVAMRVRTDYIHSRKPDSALGTSSLPCEPKALLICLRLFVSLSLTIETRLIRDDLQSNDRAFATCK
jgi:hypothetical protein